MLALPGLTEDAFLVGLQATLATDLAEERRQAVIVLLAPLFIRMVVALGALDPQTQKELRHILDLIVRVSHLADTR